MAVEEASAALNTGDWQRALELLGDDSSDEAQQIRAAACYRAGDLEGAVGMWESLHSERSRAGDLSGAAWAACMVALHLLIDTGLMSAVRAWVRRAEVILSDLDEVPAHAIVAMVSTYEHFFAGNPVESRRLAESAVALGERLDVRAAVVIGHTALGRLDVIEGDVDGGLALLQDVAAELTTGEVDPLTTGMMFCELICAAQSLGRHDLARDWTDLMDRWRHGSAFGGIHGRCRVHRAELLRLSGPAGAAEQEAHEACEELRPWLRRELGWPLVELGNIRRIRGDLEGADAAYLEAHQLVWSPQPGLALLRLEQGHLGVASALIAEAIERPDTNPSKEQPPFGDLRLAPLLAAQVEIAVACDDVSTARRAAAALADVAAHYSSPGLVSESHLAQSRLALLEGRLVDAIELSSSAIEGWGRLGAPIGTGTSRVVRGKAHRLAGSLGLATLDWEMAQRDFEDFGAVRAAASVQSLLDDQPQPFVQDRSVADDDPSSVTFERVGECRRVVWRSVEVLAPELRGFRYLQCLIERSGQDVSVTDLVSSELATSRVSPPQPGLSPQFGAGLPLSDEQARDAYRRRLIEVEEEIDDADASHDLGRLERAESDREHLIAELSRAFGLDGRPRIAGGDVERARGSVTRTLRYALGRLSQFHPELGEHLNQHIRTGTYCSYQPDALHPLTWDFG